MEGKIMFQKASKIFAFTFLAVCLICAAVSVQAKVTAEEAARLKTDLTPFGAERSGNADGTIPAWEGGLTGIPPGVSFDPNKDKQFPDPFAGDKVLFTITAQNMDQYAEKLSEGQMALLKKYPDTYKLNVYPTRRTAAAPQWVYDNTYKNALNAEIVETYSVIGAYGGIPFPIPKNGVEVMKNHISKWPGPDRNEDSSSYIVYANGESVPTAGTDQNFGFPYYEKDKSFETWDGTNTQVLSIFIDPARRKGEIILAIDPLDWRGTSDRKAWQYMPGQRRVRRAPSIAFDTPAPAAGGNGNYDDLYMFNGNMNRFDWKLVGKKECYIPYHNYQVSLAPKDDIMTPRHFNPEFVRWELHRVWVVEATLKSDKRHNYGKRVMHLDEDTWMNVLMDNYDTRGGLWRTAVGTSKNCYNIPALILSMNIFYDLQTDMYAPSGFSEKQVFGDIPDDVFTPQNVRKIGLR